MKMPLDNGRFTDRVRSHETTFGIFVGLASPLAAEVAASSGVDWVLLDCEHGAGGDEQVYTTVVATGAYDVPTLVRVETTERIRIGRALDAGAAGIMFPRIESAVEAAAAISHCHYPPFGDRGVASYNRAAQWGRNPAALEGKCSATTIAQIETRGALDDIEEIAALDGLDVLFIGPLDLSFALGIPRDFANPLFLDACRAVLAAAQRHNKTAGILAPDAPTARRYVEQGFRFIALSSDSVLLSQAISTTITAAKESTS